LDTDSKDQLLANKICIICEHEITDKKVLPCMHFYCRKCIDTWLHINNTCPICRTPSDIVINIENELQSQNKIHICKNICKYL